MKKTYFLITVLIAVCAKAQYVGINTKTPKSTLDVAAKNPTSASEAQIDGVLVARVSKARAEAMGTTVPDANLIFVDDLAAPATVGTTSLVNTKGFYYYDSAQSKWVPLNFSDNDWHTTGNTGTVAGTNYLGTNDSQSLMFKANSTKSGYIDIAAAGNTGFGYNSLTGGSFSTAGRTRNNTAIGQNTLSSASSEYVWSNVAIGNNALKDATDPRYNTAIGFNSQSKLTTARNNVSVGVGTLGNVTTGGLNTAIGGTALGELVSGAGNTALGLTALNNVTTGNANIGIGQLAGSNITTGSNNLVIGAYNNQVPDPAKNGQLNIGDLITGTGVAGSVFAATTDPKKVGIAQSSDKISEVFDVNGTARVRSLPLNRAANSIYTKTDGTSSASKDQAFAATKTVVADNNGVLGVVEGLPNSIAFASDSAAKDVSTAEIDADNSTGAGTDGIILRAGCLNFMLDPYKSGAIYYVGINLKLDDSCPSGNIPSVINAVGGDMDATVYQGYKRLDVSSDGFTATGMAARTMSRVPIIHGRIALLGLKQLYEYSYYANWNDTKKAYEIGAEVRQIQ